MLEETRFRVGHLVQVDLLPRWTSAANKMAVKAHSKLLRRTFGPYLVTLTTLNTITIDQDEILNSISADWASLAAIHMQLQDDIVDVGYNQ